jgi:EcsC protein family
MSEVLIPESEVAFLGEAAAYLESPSLLMKLADLIGKPLQLVGKIVSAPVVELSNMALRSTMSLAISTGPSTSADQGAEQDFWETYRSSDWTGFWHRLATTAKRGAGSAFGLAALGLELPVTTGIMFRSIASIAKDFGEDVRSPEILCECLTVFSFGGPGTGNDAMESTYLISRLAMGRLIDQAAMYMATKSPEAVADALLSKGSASVLVEFLNRIAAEFSLPVCEIFVAQNIPAIGFARGAAINNAFTGHFNNVARYHFGMRRLGRRYGQELVDAEYRRQLERIRALTGPRKTLDNFSRSLPLADRQHFNRQLVSRGSA